jgi:flagellar biosynthesis/type III secretory pathway protein FliH
MSTRIHRFDFSSLQDFRGPIVVKAISHQMDQDIAPPPLPAPVFSEQDIEAARISGRKQGFSEGFSAGAQEAKKQADVIAEQANESIAQLAGMVEVARTQYQALLQEESSYLSKFVLSVARKVVGEAINERGEREVIAIVEQCLPVIFSKPRLSIELNPKLFERALERIETSLRAHGFEGEVLFRANENLGLSDITLDWGSGEVRRSAQQLWEEIETLIERIPLEITFAETLVTTSPQNTTGE